MDSERRARFIAWFNDRYKHLPQARARATFMRESAQTGEPAYTKGYVSQLFNDKKPFGENAAVNMAARFRVPADTFLKSSERSAASAVLAMEPPPRVQPSLEEALPVVLEAIAGLSSMRWPMVKGALDQLATKPEMLDDAVKELAPLLRDAPGKHRGVA